MSIDSLEKLYEDQIKDVCSAEEQIIEALPKMIKAAKNTELKNAFREHHRVTKEQKKRLDQIMKSHGFDEGEECKGMKGLVEEGEELIEKGLDADACDAALIVAAQKIEHYEIASYGALKVYAKQLGHSDDAKLLDQTLKEEKTADKMLSQIARDTNQRADKEQRASKSRSSSRARSQSRSQQRPRQRA